MGGKDEFLQAVVVFINFIIRKLLFDFFFKRQWKMFSQKFFSFFASSDRCSSSPRSLHTHTDTRTQTLLLAMNGQSDVSKEEKEGGE